MHDEKTTTILSFPIGIQYGFSQSTNCSADIIYNGSWSGGSGPNGAPNSSDQNKGILIQSNVLLSDDITCKCLTIDTGVTLSVASNSKVNVIDHLTLNGDLRLLGKSQLIQNHLEQSKVS